MFVQVTCMCVSYNMILGVELKLILRICQRSIGFSLLTRQLKKCSLRVVFANLPKCGNEIEIDWYSAGISVRVTKKRTIMFSFVTFYKTRIMICNNGTNIICNWRVMPVLLYISTVKGGRQPLMIHGVMIARMRGPQLPLLRICVT